MTREEAIAYLHTQCGLPVLVEDQLGLADDDVWVYTDHDGGHLYTLTGLPDGQVHVSKQTLQQVTKRLNEEWRVVEHKQWFQEDMLLNELDICPDCGCVYDDEGHCECASPEW